MIQEGFPLFVLFVIVSEGMVPAPLCTYGRIWLWNTLDLDFFDWQTINCCLNFSTYYWSVQHCNFFLVQAWEGASVQEIIHFFQVYWLMCIELFVVISDGSLYFCGIGGDTAFIVFNFIYFLFSFLLIWLLVCPFC